MRPVLGREQIREFDRQWISRGVPGMVLMENAGRGAAHLIGLKARPRESGAAPRTGSSVVGACIRCADERSLGAVSFLVLTGSGNNGGDGFVIARHLASRGADVRVVGMAPVSELKGDARTAAEAMIAVGVPLEELPERAQWEGLLYGVDMVVDGLLGTGADREVTGAYRSIIEIVNQSEARVIALDIPSGVDAETGAVLGVAIEAEHTVTFAHLKKGLLTTFGQKQGGTVTVSHIGVPSRLAAEPSAWLIEESDLRARLSARSPVTHKGSAGRVVVVAGSPGTVGAARLASRATLRGGAGLVTILTDSETVAKLEGDVIEVMTEAWGTRDDELLGGAESIVFGPGLGQSDEALRAARRVWSARCPLVIDADGLRLLASRGRDDFIQAAPELAVLTPHPGEAAALLGCDVTSIESDRFGAAQEIAETFGAVVVLKGSRSIVAAPSETPVVSAFGSPALATAGSGDVLSGVCAALLVHAKGSREVFQAVQVAVAVHALAAERWAERNGDRGLLASEIADLVPQVLKELTTD